MTASMPGLYLVGDIGATHARFGVTSLQDGKIVVHAAVRWSAREFAGFDDALRRFLDARPPSERAVRRACLGVAGPIKQGRARLTNRDWHIDAAALEAVIDAPVILVNDFVVAATGVAELASSDLTPLQRGHPDERGPRLVIGAGSGLGIAHVVWQGDSYRVLASEGGHGGFAPQSPRQWRLAEALRATLGRIEAEHIVSGAGLERIYDVVKRSNPRAETAALRDALLRGEGAAAIGRLGLQGVDPLAAESVDLFVEIYGSVAGDHALTTLASGGVYVTGGITARLLPKLTAGGFLHAFNDKGAFRALTETFPVAAASEDRIGLYGATRIAACGTPDDGN